MPEYFKIFAVFRNSNYMSLVMGPFYTLVMKFDKNLQSREKLRNNYRKG